MSPGMRAVWSYWPRPFDQFRRGAWDGELNHLLAWALSLETARQHTRDTMLVTDEAGAELLVDGLGLEFSTVSTALNALADADTNWWSLGKLVAITEQDRPFVHLDADVFLWRDLPARLHEAPVFAQNPEPYRVADSYYDPAAFEQALSGEGWLPPEWDWYRRPGVSPRGECNGIVGGSNVAFLRHYAQTGIRLVTQPENDLALRRVPDRGNLTITMEQYLLAACVEHHRDRSDGVFGDVAIDYLFTSWQEANREAVARERGFTHLIADTKGRPDVVARLRRRVFADHPKHFARAEALAQRLDRVSRPLQPAGLTR